MIKGILTSAWILAAVAAVVLGLNGSIDPDAMRAFSLGALVLLYSFALWSARVHPRDPQPQKVKR